MVTKEAGITEQKAAASKSAPNAIYALRGKYRNKLSSSEEFAQRKAEQIKLEEKKWHRK